MKVLSLVLPLAAAAGLSGSDMRKARQSYPLPSSHVFGKTAEDIFKSMNVHLMNQPAKTQPCESFSHDQLNALTRVLWDKRDKGLASIYDGKDDKRQFHFDDITYKEKLWAEENLNTDLNKDTHGEGTFSYDMVREGKCAEIVMWWIHHLPASTRKEMSDNAEFKIPLLPAKRRETDNEEYIYQVSCTDCHAGGAESSNSTKSGPKKLRSKEAAPGDVPPGTCPPSDDNPNITVWYQPMSAVGKRLKRCDWDYDPPCQPCEGVGGWSWGEGEHEITYTECEMISMPADIPQDNITTPSWPKSFTVKEVTTLINEKDNFGGQFPGANPCKLHTFENGTETFYYKSDYEGAGGKGPIMFLNTSAAPIWSLPNFDMFILLREDFCMCVTPREVGTTTKDPPPTGPLYHDFAKDAVLVGRERIALEGFNVKVVADHWNKGPHHFWVDVQTNLFVRGWQPWNGLNVYGPGTWQVGDPEDLSVFEVSPLCLGDGWKNVSCLSAYPTPPSEW